jgi:hypothetical protein
MVASAVDNDYEIRPPSSKSDEYEVRPPDFTVNKIDPNTGKGYGLYDMTDKSGKIQKIPYINVGPAFKVGYRLTPEHAKTYMRDAAADPALKDIAVSSGVKVVGRNTAGQPMVAPEDDKQGLWKTYSSDLLSALKGAAAVFDPRTNEYEKSHSAFNTPIAAAGGPVTRLIEPQVEEGEKSLKAVKSGQPYEAAMHGGAAIIPGVGPWAEQVREQSAEKIAARDWWGLLGVGLGALSIYEAPHLPKDVAKVMAKIPAVHNVAQTMLGAGGRVVKRGVIKAAEDANKEAEKVEKENIEAQGKHRDAGKVAREANRENTAKFRKESTDSDRQNEAAKAIPDARKGLEDHIELQSKERNRRIIDAQKKAKAEADKRYDDQRQLLNDETIPPDITPGALNDLNVSDRIVSAYESRITGTEGALPKIIKSIQDRMNSSDPMTWRDLQGYRSEIGKQLSGGHLPGDEYQGYKAALEVVDDGLQKIADNFGVGDQVKSDRAFYRHYMETFHDPIRETNTVARKSQTTTSSDFMRDSGEDDRRAMLASYDPEIGRLGEAIDRSKEVLDALPSDTTARGMIKEPPIAPGIQTVEKLKQEPVEIPEVDTQKMRDDFIDKKLASWTDVSRWQIARLLTGPIGVIIGLTTNHPLVGDIGAAYAVAEMTPFMIQHMLDDPKVRAWFTKPPKGELETLQKVPFADRIHIVNGLSEVLRQAAAQKRPIAVSPAVSAFLKGGIVSQNNEKSDSVSELVNQIKEGPTELLKQAEELQKSFSKAGMAPPSSQAVPAGVHPSATHYYDESSGTIVPVQ